MLKCPKCKKNNFTFGKINDKQIFVCEECNFIFDIFRNHVELGNILKTKKKRKKKKK